MRSLLLHRRTVKKDAPEIIAHVNRRGLVSWLLLSGVCVLLGLLPTIGMGILLAISAYIRDQSAAVIALMHLFGSLIVLSIWQTRMFLRLFFLKGTNSDYQSCRYPHRQNLWLYQHFSSLEGDQNSG